MSVQANLQNELEIQSSVLSTTTKVDCQYIQVEEEFSLSVSEYKKEEILQFRSKPVDKKMVQIYFCVKGGLFQSPEEGGFALNEKNVLLSFLDTSLMPKKVLVIEKTILINICISIHKLHQIFLSQKDFLKFIFEAQLTKQIVYKVTQIAPLNHITLSQILQEFRSNKTKDIYLKAKAYELLSVFVDQALQKDKSICPYVLQKANIKKIELAKNIIVSNLSEPPALSSLSKQVMLSPSILKKGFKELYGTTIYNYLHNYRLEKAKELLITQKTSVKAVALEIGYSTASHFINAFKKKYGTTPKKYITNLN